jgi:plastocyanin
MKLGRTILIASLVAVALAGAALAGLVSRDRSTTARVTVTEVEYRLKLSTSHLAPGKVTLVVTNKGKLAHSLSISGPGLKKRLISGTLRPGTTRSLSLTLKSGSFALWCPVPGHAALGMKTSLTVRSAAAAGTTARTTTKSSWG